MASPSLCTVISGSYRRHLRKLYLLKEELEGRGLLVLSPVGSLALNPDEEFIFLDADPTRDKKLLQDSVFAKIRSSSFLTLANFEGYLGRAALIEAGYALAFGLQILSVEPVEDPNLSPYVKLLGEAFPQIEELLWAN